VTVGDLGEATLISRIRSRVPPAPSWILTSIGDDGAVFEPARGTVDVITTDTLVEGTHFDKSFVPSQDIGHKSLAVNLSDLAAMGATPRVTVLSLILPPTLLANDLDAILGGILALADQHNIVLAGGNITSTHGPLVIGMTALGSVRRRRIISRAGGRPGDELWVTGDLGAAAAGLDYLQHQPTTLIGEHLDMRHCVDRYRRPEPRVRIGMLLGRNKVARAGVDLSDGLADGLRQITSASGTGTIIDGPSLPLDPQTKHWFSKRGLDPLLAALTGGDDYELLIAVPRSHRRRLFAISRLTDGVPLTRIGELTEPPSLVLHTPSGNQDLPAGYQHFNK